MRYSCEKCGGMIVVVKELVGPVGRSSTTRWCSITTNVELASTQELEK